ncbi:MAG TPA: flagellar protein FliT, partial [Candidatus Tenderia sp.]|nr:flagellar protein FliT [Candidatus Tenderia sp.]
MFFTDDRNHFFRPLVGKYREQTLECLRQLYGQLYSAMADYRRTLNRVQVIEIFQEAITRTPVLEGEEGEPGVLVKSERERASWILNQLLEYGWLERLVDEATLQSSYAFTRVGRLFTQPMVETAGGHFRTRHRNTRNTRNALQSFLDKGEVYDLLDAFEYSERIVSDFSDVIAELDERTRDLVHDVEVQRASDEFFDFMEKRFTPDLAIRLTTDSVEKYR